MFKCFATELVGAVSENHFSYFILSSTKLKNSSPNKSVITANAAAQSNLNRLKTSQTNHFSYFVLSSTKLKNSSPNKGVITVVFS